MRFPRTSAEAFKGPEYADPISYYRGPRYGRWITLAIAVAVVVICTWLAC